MSKLSIRWSKRAKDHVISYPRRCDGRLLELFFFLDVCPRDGIPPLIEELEARGYDPETLKFSIERKA